MFHRVDVTLCQELRLLESKFITGQANPMHKNVHFLNELGWLFQRKEGNSDYSHTRFKSCLYSLWKEILLLLGILLKKSSGITDDELSLEMLSGINLLNRPVKRKCKNMVDLLIHYSVVDTQTTSYKYVSPQTLRHYTLAFGALHI